MAFSGAAPVERRSLGERLAGHATVLVLLALIVIFVGLVSVLYVTHTTAKVDGTSMEPGLLPADVMLVTRGYDHPVRGDIVVIKAPNDPTVMPGSELVKRVVAIPGDEIKVVEGVAFVNGQRERGNYTVEFYPGDIGMSSIRVPDGQIVVLGDNRPVSEDSRIFGPVGLDSVVGRVVSIIAPINRFGRVD